MNVMTPLLSMNIKNKFANDPWTLGQQQMNPCCWYRTAHELNALTSRPKLGRHLWIHLISCNDPNNEVFIRLGG